MRKSTIRLILVCVSLSVSCADDDSGSTFDYRPAESNRTGVFGGGSSFSGEEDPYYEDNSFGGYGGNSGSGTYYCHIGILCYEYRNLPDYAFEQAQCTQESPLAPGRCPVDDSAGMCLTNIAGSFNIGIRYYLTAFGITNTTVQEWRESCELTGTAVWVP